MPAGTLEAGERPEDGALREALEETGLQSLTVMQLLGEAERDMRDFGHDQLHHRYFFHLVCNQKTPETWQHSDPSPYSVSGESQLLPFRFRWVEIPYRVPPLIADFGYYLPALYDALAPEDNS